MLTAAEWLVRLEDGPLDALAQERFEVWLAADPAHAEALSGARDVWRQAEALRPRRDALMARALPGARVLGPVLSAWRVPIAAAASLLLAIGGAALYTSVTTPDFQTRPGEVRTFTLADGSRLTLDSDSAADLAFDGKTRRIALRAGAAYVRAAPKQGTETRPFVVAARGGESQALGTQFAVEYLDQGVRVSVTEHRVRVSDAGGQAVLDAGQSVVYGRDGWQAVQAAPIAQAALWREGRMVFDRAPLKDVVAQLNRYRKDRIYIVGRALGERRVSGVFDVHDPKGALTAITIGLHTREVSTPAVTVLYTD
ncbi:MAG: FecR domain-containing protein [Asticcacaulis sp.]